MGIEILRTFPELALGGTITVRIDSVYPYRYQGGCATGEVAETLLRSGEGDYDVQVRCLGALPTKVTRGPTEASWIEEAMQTYFLIEQASWLEPQLPEPF